MKRLKYFTVFLWTVLAGTSCRSNNNEDFIDYIKVSDDTYLGVSVVKDSLEVPWDIQYNENTKSLFFTEIKGGISEIDLVTNKRYEIYKVPKVFHRRTAGLLGMALHPDFKNKPYIYVCYTTKEGDSVFSELAKLEYKDHKIVGQKVLLKIEGANGHNGSRIIFDNMGLLYWATGDAHSLTHAQDSTTLNGKILRMTDDGLIPQDNPIANSYVYAWGFRNIQGMTLTENGNIMTSEHGDAIEDEINWIRPLNNYGWIDIEGYHDTEEEKAIAAKSSRTEPIKSWTPVIAPAAVKYYNNQAISSWTNSLLLVSLKNQSLRILKLNEHQNGIVDEKIYLKDHYGRLRAVTADREGNIYIATSNRDWNPREGFPKPQDDRILKIQPVKIKPEQYIEAYKEDPTKVKDGKTLYNVYCASCHKDNGQGLQGTFPPLKKTSTIQSKDKLITTILVGLPGGVEIDGIKYEQAMPSFQFLTDEEVAKIASYVRANFGNALSAIGETEVMLLRTKK